MSWGDAFSQAWNEASEAARAQAHRFAENADALYERTADGARYVRDQIGTQAAKARALYQSARQKLSRAANDLLVATCHRSLPVEDFFYREIAGRGTSWFGTVKSWVTTESVDITFTDAQFQQWTGGLTVEQSQALYEAQTGKSISRDTIEVLFTDPVKARAILLKDADIHRHYRDLLNQNIPTDLETTVQSDDWMELSTSKSVFHGSVTRSNRKFVSKDGYREAIFRPDGTLDTRSELKGTFNFFSPNDYPDSHIAVDVDPYVAHGN